MSCSWFSAGLDDRILKLLEIRHIASHPTRPGRRAELGLEALPSTIRREPKSL